LAGLDARPGCDRAQGGQHAVFRGVRRGQDLPGKSPLADFQRHVGERAADIDAEPDCRGGCHACALKPLSGNDSNVSDVSGQSTPAPARKSLARLPFSLHLPRPQARRRGVHACSQDAVPGLVMLETRRGTREAGDRRMTNNALSAAALTAALALSSHALARAPAPLVPIALVEDVKSASADVLH